MKRDAGSSSLWVSQRRRAVTVVVLLALASLSALDHKGSFGDHQNDHDKFHGAVGTVMLAGCDTVDVSIPERGAGVTHVRLWGVGCSEGTPQRSEPYDRFATETLNCTLQSAIGQQVRLDLDPLRASRDRSGCLLAYVYLVESGEMLNELLIRNGRARADGRIRHIYHDRFARGEREAIRRRAGMWARGQRVEMQPGEGG